MPSVAQVTQKTTVTPAERAPELPTGRAPDVGWAVSPTMQRIVRHVSSPGRLDPASMVAGDTPYVPQAIRRASRVVVIGKRGAAA